MDSLLISFNFEKVDTGVEWKRKCEIWVRERTTVSSNVSIWLKAKTPLELHLYSWVFTIRDWKWMGEGQTAKLSLGWNFSSSSCVDRSLSPSLCFLSFSLWYDKGVLCSFGLKEKWGREPEESQLEAVFKMRMWMSVWVCWYDFQIRDLPSLSF